MKLGNGGDFKISQNFGSHKKNRCSRDLESRISIPEAPFPGVGREKPAVPYTAPPFYSQLVMVLSHTPHKDAAPLQPSKDGNRLGIKTSVRKPAGIASSGPPPAGVPSKKPQRRISSRQYALPGMASPSPEKDVVPEEAAVDHETVEASVQAGAVDDAAAAATAAVPAASASNDIAVTTPTPVAATTPASAHAPAMDKENVTGPPVAPASTAAPVAEPAKAPTAAADRAATQGGQSHHAPCSRSVGYRRA